MREFALIAESAFPLEIEFAGSLRRRRRRRRRVWIGGSGSRGLLLSALPSIVLL